ncbi:MAG: DUF4338 domain-containing protein [Acidobacteria bacterium]|nr:DUF4338 domain-containing protein [Acidobacteriota bacterium]
MRKGGVLNIRIAIVYNSAHGEPVARDRWIGWVPVVQSRRLHLIANNSRYLVLPGVGVPNLASGVLSLTLRRLSQDWEIVHGNPVLLAETFVDLSRFTGACYRAANWRALGLTRGYPKSGRLHAHRSFDCDFDVPLLPRGLT